MTLESEREAGAHTRADWRALLRKHEIRPDKRLGQNFLIDRAALKRVVQAAELSGRETVLEIGAGVGSLTCQLAGVAERVIAVEFDRRLLPALSEVVGPLHEVEIIEGDILSFNLTDLVGPNSYVIVANIPYNITSALLRHMLEAPRQPDRIVLTLQREVAERIVAPPGQMSLLALSVQIYGSPTLQGRIRAAAFHPRPRVDSEVLRIDIHDTPAVPPYLIDPLFQLARAGFGQKRKQLRNALSGGLGFDPSQAMVLFQAAHLAPTKRAQELSLKDWTRLADALQNYRPPQG